MPRPLPFRPADRASRCLLRLVAAAVPTLLALAGCASLQSSDNLLGIITPYRIEVVQGNVVTSEQAALVKPGMNRAQVRDILGSPLLTDMFHADRWDYVFTIRRQGAEPQRRSVVVRFDSDRLTTIDAPALPSELEFVGSIDTLRTRRSVPTLALTDDQIKALPVPPRAVAPTAAATAAPQRRYPPLEPPG